MPICEPFKTASDGFPLIPKTAQDSHMVWGLLTFLCSYGEKTLNLKWFVLSLTTLIILMPMIMKITTMTWLSTRILWEIRSPLGGIVSLGTISSIITHMIKTIITSNVFVWVLDNVCQTLVRSLYTLLVSIKLTD